MNEFDRFFNERLNEEQRFPNQAKSWQQLTRRLDAFEAGGGGALHVLRWWQAAAAAALVAGSLLLWHNNKLRQEIVELRRQQTAMPAPLHSSDTTSYSSTSTIPRGGIQPASSPQSPADEEQPFHLSLKKRTPSDKNHTPDPPSQIPDAPTAQRLGDSDVAPAAAHERIAALEQRLDSLLQQLSIAQNVSVPAAAPNAGNRLLPLAPLLNANIDSVVATARPDTVAALAQPLPPAIIEPVRADKRLRLGVEAVVAVPMPFVKDVSALQGSGFTAGYDVWKGIRLMASAASLHYEIDAVRRPNRHNLPETPDTLQHGPGPHPGQDDFVLAKVEARQRQQQYALGLTYSFPLRGRLRPVARLSHAWVRVPGALVRYQYDEQPGGPGGPGHPHDPEFRIKESETRWYNNNWRLGAGLEYNTRDWAFALNADYSHNPDTQTGLFDAVLLRAGAQYKF